MISREPEENPNSEVESEVTKQTDDKALQPDIDKEKEKAENYLANWQRAQADFVNYKRRSEREKEEINKFANSALMLTLLPILDDLERAFASIPPGQDKLSWLDGIRLIERKLQASLEGHGLSPIQTLDEPFDPNLHEAAMHRKGKEGIVIEELQKGYKLHDRVLRPATVVVGEGKTEETQEAEQENSGQGDSSPS